MSNTLLSSYTLGSITLQNRMVMAPMTRSRAVEANAPNALMAEYYTQRASAGLIITEGVAPSPNGLGYARIPGLYSEAQIAGWKLVADAVHEKGGRIFAQVMHCGRIGHPANVPDGGEMVAPSAIAAKGQMWTDTQGMKDHPVPREMTLADIEQAKAELVQAARNAIAAGLDGVELHGANGYLIDQFLQPASNQRTDAYGGSAENRNRFALEVAHAVVDAIGADKVGIRLSPGGAFNDVTPFEGQEEQYLALVRGLSDIGLVYLHLVDHSAMGAPPPPAGLRNQLRDAFAGTFILSGGYDGARAEADLAENHGDLVAFGRPFLANPDLVERIQKGAELNAPNFDLFYTPGPEGYTDYPTLAG
jgi:N-ethylmaleimide reductase